MSDHPTADDLANKAERDLAYAWECADRLAEALECVLDDSHSYESEGYARQDARQALAEYRKAR